MKGCGEEGEVHKSLLHCSYLSVIRLIISLIISILVLIHVLFYKIEMTSTGGWSNSTQGRAPALHVTISEYGPLSCQE